jgi:phytase-like protein/Big-like domain-containing protein
VVPAGGSTGHQARAGRGSVRLWAATAVTVGCLVAVLIGTASGRAAQRPKTPHTPLAPQANDDSYATTNVGTLFERSRDGLLANDGGGSLQMISHTDPAHGSLTLKPDGAFEYVPQAGFTGTDTFTYTVANAVALFSTHLPSLGTFGGVSLSGGGYGSSLYPVPGHPDEFYGLEDRGPNVSAPNGDDVLPIPSFDPAIGEFRFESDGRAKMIRKIKLRDTDGHPYSGLVNSQNPTGETIEDLAGNVLAQDPNGYDSEGLVALPDGSFWVSDEYGPFITHFNSRGRAIQRLSPLDGSLPHELLNRVPNRGMEGLTITPDGKTLVGMMQSSLQQPDLAGSNAKNLTPLRIVTYGLRTHQLHEYLYLLHDPKTNGTAVSELTALSDTTFLVDERDGKFPAAGGFKKLFEINLAGATDVGPDAHVPGAVYDGSGEGLLVGGQSIELLTKGDNTVQSQAALQAAGITPVSSSLFLDMDSLLLSLDSQGRFYSHDKIEGVAALNGGHEIVISNDSDFGISGVTNAAPPWQLQSKISPATGQQDDGEYLEIDPDKLSSPTGATPSAAQTSTATVTIKVSADPS